MRRFLAKVLGSIGLQFTGVVETAIKQFPKSGLGLMELQGRGDKAYLINKDASGVVQMIALLWVDR